MQTDIYNPAKPFNEQIRRFIQDTHPQDGPIILRPQGKRFRRIMDNNYWKDYDPQDATDGIGTKGMLHWHMDTPEDGVQDVAAMVWDDLMEGNFVPVYLQDHILMQEENEKRIFRITRKLRDLCVQNQWETSDGKTYPIVVTGGETAIINTLQGFEMGITATGYVRKGEEITPNVQEGDVVIGLGSSGIHSNGLSFYRGQLFDKLGMKLDDIAPWDVNATIGKELTIPTHVYMPALKKLIKRSNERSMKPKEYIHGMVHITGGGLSKLRELLPEEGNVDIEIGRDHPLYPQYIFQYAHKLGTTSEKMYTRFNNGIGYVVAVPKQFAEDALAVLRQHFPAEIIGQVSSGRGRVLIESQYDDKTIQF